MLSLVRWGLLVISAAVWKCSYYGDAVTIGAKAREASTSHSRGFQPHNRGEQLNHEVDRDDYDVLRGAVCATCGIDDDDDGTVHGLQHLPGVKDLR